MNRAIFISVVIYFSFASIVTKYVAAPFVANTMLRILDVQNDWATYIYVAAVVLSGLAFFFVGICWIILFRRIKRRAK